MPTPKPAPTPSLRLSLPTSYTTTLLPDYKDCSGIVFTIVRVRVRASPPSPSPIPKPNPNPTPNQDCSGIIFTIDSCDKIRMCVAKDELLTLDLPYISPYISPISPL